jgi:transcriptional regulator with XRE-family HTH domain
MRRTEVLQGRRMMKFEALYSRRQARQLTQDQAAEILGISVRTLQRSNQIRNRRSLRRLRSGMP